MAFVPGFKHREFIVHVVVHVCGALACFIQHGFIPLPFTCYEIIMLVTKTPYYCYT